LWDNNDQAITATMSKDALQHLQREKKFAALIGRVGPPKLGVQRNRSPYEALMRAIAHQQLHGRAAQAILARFECLSPDGCFPPPEQVLDCSADSLKACGFSGSKIAAMRAIAGATLDGTVPTRRGSARLSDEELIQRLTSIRGVGRWTVEMLLIFTLGRPDVLPVDDYGVRDGYRHLYGLDEQPKPKALAEIGQVWAPHRSIAAWYLWRASDEAKRAKVATSRA
jgi:DNA-3-methyladenine glycosylase II